MWNRGERWAEIRLPLSAVSVYYRPRVGWVACTLYPQGRRGPWTYLRWEAALEGLKVKRIEVGAGAVGTSGGTHLAPVDSTILSQCQGLIGHLAVVRYDDGSVRRTGWMTLKTMGSSWVVQLKDPDSASSIQAIGASLDDALALAELLVSSEQAPWEHDPWLAKSKDGGKPKK